MLYLSAKSGWGYRLIRTLAATSAASWLLARGLHHVDRVIMRISRGAHSATSLLSGIPTVLLTTRGAHSGKMRTVPLVAMADNEKVILVGSNFGRRRSPAWYHNLRAHPEAVLGIQGHSNAYVAHEAIGEERDLYWQRVAAIYVGFSAYNRRAGARRIPIMVLTPLPDP